MNNKIIGESLVKEIADDLRNRQCRENVEYYLKEIWDISHTDDDVEEVVEDVLDELGQE
tara:strand:- start:1 stop:177 length:177 start_codon:yes stop_codon:yes gene_type:complete